MAETPKQRVERQERELDTFLLEVNQAQTQLAIEIIRNYAGKVIDVYRSKFDVYVKAILSNLNPFGMLGSSSQPAPPPDAITGGSFDPGGSDGMQVGGGSEQGGGAGGQSADSDLEGGGSDLSRESSGSGNGYIDPEDPLIQLD